jgi:hypothetical protein
MNMGAKKGGTNDTSGVAEEDFRRPGVEAKGGVRDRE